MDILSIQKAVIKQLEKESRSQLAFVARRTGLSVGGLRKLRAGERTDPRVSTVAALAAFYGINGETNE